MTDWELVAEAQAGDLDAFETLVRRYEKPVVGFCLRMVHSREDAEDLAQESFVRVYRHLPRLKPKAKFTTVLFGIARNLTLNHIRDRRRQGSNDMTSLTMEEGAELSVADNRHRPDQGARLSEVQSMLETALADLSPEHREVLILRELEGMDYESISAIVQCRKGTVKSRVSRAREQLRLRLIELGGANI